MDIQQQYQLYSLTSPQLGIWNTEKRYPGTSISVIAATLKLKGDIDYGILEKAVNLFIERNDGLRLRFVEQDGEPRQYLMPYQWHPIDLIDFADKGIDALYQWDNSLTQVPLALSD
ncbi:MAG TPA: condensation domain-containing protein, partial [Clostridia bacterium]